MKRAAWIAISSAAVALAGCGKNTDETNSRPTNDVAATATEAAVVAPVSAGQQFADTAAASDTFEIETSRLAATKASSPKVKKFAEQMIKAHTESTAKLKAAGTSASPAIVPAAQLSATQQQTLDALASKSGADFDAAYAKAQVDGHQAALDALKAYSTTGDVPALKAFATQSVPVVTAHLNMAKAL